MLRPGQARDSIVLVGSLTAVAALTWLLRMRPNVSTATVSLALLVVVLGTATLARLRIASIVSVVAIFLPLEPSRLSIRRTGGGEERRTGDPESHLFPFHVAARRHRRRRLIGPDGR